MGRPHSASADGSEIPRHEYRAIAHCLRRSIRRPTSPPMNPPRLNPNSPRPPVPSPSARSCASTSIASLRVMFRINALARITIIISRGSARPNSLTWSMDSGGRPPRTRPSTRACAASADRGLAAAGSPPGASALPVSPPPMGLTLLVCLAISWGRIHCKLFGTPISSLTARTFAGSLIATACHSLHMRLRSASSSSVYSPWSSRTIWTLPVSSPRRLPNGHHQRRPPSTFGSAGLMTADPRSLPPTDPSPGCRRMSMLPGCGSPCTNPWHASMRANVSARAEAAAAGSIPVNNKTRRHSNCLYGNKDELTSGSETRSVVNLHAPHVLHRQNSAGGE